jgi:hypothetical protein
MCNLQARSFSNAAFVDYKNGAKNLFLALEFLVDQRSRYGCLFGDVFERALRYPAHSGLLVGKPELIQLAE